MAKKIAIDETLILGDELFAGSCHMGEYFLTAASCKKGLSIFGTKNNVVEEWLVGANNWLIVGWH